MGVLYSMIWVSSGTMIVLGLKKARCDVPPDVAYLMIGNGCLGSCKFCTQSKESTARDHFLSRVSWLLFPREEVFKRISKEYNNGKLSRVCFQVVNKPGVIYRAKKVFQELRQYSEIPASISCNCLNRKGITELFSEGIDTISIPLDAATPGLYRELKGGIWEEHFKLLIWASRKYPGKVTTHLIAGLGETEKDLVRTLECLYAYNVKVGLFAFTPVLGTALEAKAPPSMASYRRLQVAHYLIKNRISWKFEFKEEKLYLGDNVEKLFLLIGSGEPFETSGCFGCNRPYYNERPGKIPYNYPRKLNDDEIREAYKMLMR